MRDRHGEAEGEDVLRHGLRVRDQGQACSEQQDADDHHLAQGDSVDERACQWHGEETEESTQGQAVHHLLYAHAESLLHRLRQQADRKRKDADYKRLRDKAAPYDTPTIEHHELP